MSTSLWQMPHASTFTRTCPGPGCGMSRSTNSQFPPGLPICAAFIVFINLCSIFCRDRAHVCLPWFRFWLSPRDATRSYPSFTSHNGNLKMHLEEGCVLTPSLKGETGKSQNRRQECPRCVAQAFQGYDDLSSGLDRKSVV